MISLTKLLFDVDCYGDLLRYHRPESWFQRKPIVVWNTTRRCNLSCRHCYASASNDFYDELTKSQAKNVIADLAEFKVPVILFSGGEPLLHKDLFELNEFARSYGLRTVISTNGTLINRPMAVRIRQAGFDYVGISIDGVGDRHDYFRGCPGAFEKALTGIRNLVACGQKVGLRMTLTQNNYPDIEKVFQLAEDESIDRICFYHLVYTGRASKLRDVDLTHGQTRVFMDTLIDWIYALKEKRITKEVLTVNNHANGAYLYMHLLKHDPQRAQIVWKYLEHNGGNGSGISIACIDNIGFVHPDQFWQSACLGNVIERRFSQIWTDTSHALLKRLKSRHGFLEGRCHECRFLSICNGNFRARAEAVYGNPWQADPACYLTDTEIAQDNHVTQMASLLCQ